MYINLDNEEPMVVDYLTSTDKVVDIAQRYGLKSATALKERVKKVKKFNFVELTSPDVARQLSRESQHASMFYRLVGNRPNLVTQTLYELFLSEDYMKDTYYERGMTPEEIANEVNFPFLDKDQVARRVEKLHLTHKKGTQSEIAKRLWSNKEERLERTRKTNMDKWGVPYTTQTENMKSRTKQTMLERYGVEHALQVKEFSDKAKNTTQERYGVEHISLSHDYRAGRVDWHETKYVHSAKEALELMEPDEDGVSVGLLNLLRLLVDKGDYEFFTLNTIADEVLGLNRWYFTNPPYRVEIDGTLIVTNRRGEQGEVADFIASLIGEEFEQDKFYPFMNRQQLDIFVPSHKFAVEFNGTYWHSNEGRGITKADKTPEYHANKTRMARDSGITLMHIWEYDWKKPNKQAIIKSQIKYHLNRIDQRLYARNLEVRAVGSKEERSFLELNHIQGYVASSEKYGLYDGNTLVALMTFGKRRFDSEQGWELLRFATLLNTSVAGGASKLLSHFAKQHKGDKLLSYANNDFAYTGDKSLYSNLGFTYVRTTVPGYRWVNTQGDIVSRYKVQVHKLKAFTAGEMTEPFPGALPDFSDTDTESTYMVRNWYYKVYDAGNDVYERNL